ncbi:uncharacterized protein LOC110443619 isoform X2 [Mizuhopecten yessoensis]|uniref:Apple domain-containing protein n=1 Tax=Mizuhopecten yessoensis TaxID=6573 RepID=A0A210PEI4_MIZYE|nr:uncharacterized protein LOC110443619 isoform X2 [Mizuhopecten yessoensis]OWF34898.1 hypothetical protein KP79_PYT08696 [Mizuhopecten yessoensis]
MEWLSVFVLASVLVSARFQQQGHHCDSFNELTTHASVQGNGPSLPQLPDSFQTNLEVNLMELNTTKDVVEYFDNTGNRATLVTYSEGTETRVIFNYESNELYYITNGVCQLSILSDSMYSDLFGVEDSDGYKHIMTSNTALKFGQSYGERYIGKDVIRGISVNHWQACLYWARKDANFTVDYYFSDSIWHTSSEFLSVPVRADAKGVMNKPGGAQNFHHVYDFYAFKPFAGDNQQFETPPGVICSGRQKGQAMPALPKQFYYRQEVVSPEDGFVTSVDVWYDEAYRLVRLDYRPLRPGPPFYNVNPITQIDDFNGGVRYMKDNIMGNCTIMALDNATFGAMENQTLLHNNGSFLLQMKNPLQLFTINKNFTFVGQRPCRDLQCDVFSSKMTHFYVEGQNQPINTTIEAFFLSRSMYDVPNHGTNTDEFVPIRLTVASDTPWADFYRVYNIIDFDNQHADLSSYQISSCYPPESKFQFNIRFPALYNQDTADIFKLKTRLLMAEKMSVSPIRVQDVFVERDVGDVFLFATLLDRTPATAQFTYITGREIEKHDDMVIPKTTSPMECADFCVDLKNITCNSFDFCPMDSGSCRLSRSHIGDGTAVLIQSPCSHYSRNVNAPRRPEVTILDAYAALRIAVYNQELMFQVEEDNSQMVEYEAVDTQVIQGLITPVAMPKLSGQFSYSQEVTIPSIAEVYSSKVWYDSSYKFVRYDYHQSYKPTPPFYSTNPMTLIHDFNTGVAYTIDRDFENCTVAPIGSAGIDSEVDPKVALKNGAYVVQMKSPLEFFHISNNYKFIGQKSIRGQLCSGYEILVQNFGMPGLSFTNNTALIRYFFLEGGWTEVPEDSRDLTFSQPVRMEMTIMQQSLFIAYDFFDFEEVSHPDLSVFDIRKCFSEANQRHFQIQFPGKFHPFLDIYSKIFQLMSQIKMSECTNASVIRFQGTQVDYDDDNIYVTSTLLGRNPFLDDFTLVPGTFSPHKSDANFPNIGTVKSCADLCSSLSSFPCNSFDYCPQANYCFLNKNHSQDGAKVNVRTVCYHYSKTVQASTVSIPSIQQAYTRLKNVVYSGKFNVTIPNGEMAKIFSASSIRDDIVRPNGQQQTGRILSRFHQMKNSILSGSGDGQETRLAVDDCAAACLGEDLFDCQSFSYCYNSETCLLSATHPDENLQQVKYSSACDLFSRQYLDNYDELPGMVFKMTATNALTVKTNNLCAQRCTTSLLCKSFDYCASSKSCLLRRKHTLDVPDSFLTTSPQCNHYSKKYLFDFKKNEGKQMNYGPALLFRGISVEQCAKSCVEEQSINCHSFDFCSNTSTCMLHNPQPKQAPPGSVVASANCSLYTRRFFPGMTPSSNMPTIRPYNPGNNPGTGCGQSASKTDSSSSNASAGAFVGVAFGVFLPGLVLGAVIVTLFRSYREKKIKKDEMNVTFVKDDHELT